MKYRVIQSGDLDDLSRLVEEASLEGWTVQGGVGSYLWREWNGAEIVNNSYFIQAMVKV